VKPLPTIQLEGAAERVRRALYEAVTALQKLPFVPARVIRNITLENGASKLVPHGLGREPVLVIVGAPRAPGGAGSGAINEDTSGVDRTKFVKLYAIDFAQAVTFDVAVL